MSPCGSYYNEIDPFAADWLRELIKAGQIADGDVDERSIVDVRPDDLRGYRQCHFFAGIGGWSYALRLAGWPDDRPIWTGSCPCQPFSSAGKGGGFADERHLWPSWHWLIEQCRPGVVAGEQVNSPAGRAWLDLVCTDLEAAGYAIGAVDCPAAGVGAPHIRQRLYWVADCDSIGSAAGCIYQPGGADEGREARRAVTGRRDVRGLADESSRGQRIDRGASRQPGHVDIGGASQRLVDRVITRLERLGGDGDRSCESRRLGPDAARSVAAAGATRGAWADADWLLCTDQTFRPVEPGTFPLAHGVSARVGRLRGYGNAIVPQVAAVFIQAYCEARQ